ncbi:hypothetical protein [Paraburkholderia caballeronis]|uniref:hypothetical protein n=1 Tax=Paraburkholderia caballeronis TaxID=416943 RepID=UPI001FB9BFE0|nr:hypothetical protein [Paraburkholderia caballeronis]
MNLHDAGDYRCDHDAEQRQRDTPREALAAAARLRVAVTAMSVRMARVTVMERKV